jgi:hypothetical protein
MVSELSLLTWVPAGCWLISPDLGSTDNVCVCVCVDVDSVLAILADSLNDESLLCLSMSIAATDARV